MSLQTPTLATTEAPMVPGYPFVGRMMDFQRDPLSLLVSVAEQYGDISQMQVMSLTCFVLRTPEAVKHVLVDNSRNYSVGINTRLMMGYWLGEGLFVSEGDNWLRQRRLMQPTFHRHVIQSYGTLMTEAALDLCHRWKERGESPFDLFEEMQQLTLYVAAKAFLNVDIRGDAAAFGHAVGEMVEFYGRWVRTAILALVPPRYMTYVPRFRRALNTMDTIVYRLIAERRQSVATQDDLLSLLLNARDEETGESMSDQQLRDEVMTLLFAGHETTASALTWTFYLLSKHPDVRQRLQEELEKVLAGREPNLDDLTALPYTRQVIQESLRLYPPAWGLFRVAVEEDTLLGYRIRPKDRIALSPYVIHRNPVYWPDPERFDPDRFEAKQAEARPRYAYLPFGGGARQCIGQHFAMLEMQLVLATLAQHFTLDLVPNHPVIPEALITLRPRHGMHMIPRTRLPS
jgi:cytochrome P450